MARLENDEAVALSAAILKQAVDDYRYLLRTGKTEAGDDDTGRFSKSELEEFFRSEYGDALVQEGLHLKKMSGMDFLRTACL